MRDLSAKLVKDSKIAKCHTKKQIKVGFGVLKDHSQPSKKPLMWLEPLMHRDSMKKKDKKIYALLLIITILIQPILSSGTPSFICAGCENSRFIA